MILLEAYQQPYDSIMAMPSSRRHRFVKIREEIKRNPHGRGGQKAPPPGGYTGLSPKMDAGRSDPTQGAWGA